MRQFNNKLRYPHALKEKEQVHLYGYGHVGKGVVQLWDSERQNQEIGDVQVKNQFPSDFPFAGAWKRNEDEVHTHGLVIDAMADTQKSIRLFAGLDNEELQVVTASKDAVAKSLDLIAGKKNVRYEASVAGSIPVIQLIDEYYQYHKPLSFTGILNGSCNYILDAVNEGKSFDDALAQAQELGFAEADPSFDIEGIDTLNKTQIVLYQMFGLISKSLDIPKRGITGIPNFVFKQVREQGLKIKLIARGVQENGTVSTWVWPTLIKPDNTLSNVHKENNGVIIETEDLGEQVLIGKGAGSLPTAGAVALDLRKISNGLGYSPTQENTPELGQNKIIEVAIYSDNAEIAYQNISLSELESLSLEQQQNGGFVLVIL